MSVAPGRPNAARDHLIGAALAVAYVALLIATAPDLAMSRDESIYVHAADSYGQWLEALWTHPQRALSQPSIDRAWRANHEHPPLAKLLFTLGHLSHTHLGVPATPSLSYRLGGMLCAGLLLWLIHVFGAQLYGRRAGLMAALCYALLPRPFYHAHLDCFDVPITLAITFCAYLYLRGLTRRRDAVYLGLAYGLALATKHNSWALPIIFGIHFALVHLLRHRSGQPAAGSPIGRRPDWLLSMLLLGPLVAIALWPWLWHDTLRRIDRYAAFHLRHEYYNIAYFGRNYFWPPFPVSYPWVMTLFTVPLTTLCLSFVGLGERCARLVAAVRARRPTQDPRMPTLLLLGCLFAPLVMISLPSTPIFGGTKHWLPAYPFMALFAGRGFDLALKAAAQRWQALRDGVRPQAVAVIAGGLLLLPAAVETAHSHPFGLSHYGVAAGGVPGAAALGMNRQFWGFTTGSVAGYLRRNLPHGGSVYICDTTGWAFRMLQRDGQLPANIRATGDLARADYALVHHELHFAEVDFQIWSAHGRVAPEYVLAYDGVPIVSVYRNPASKR